MSRIDDLIAEHCPDGVEHKPLGHVGEFIRGNGIQKKDLQGEGMGAIHYGQVFTTYGTSARETVSFVDPALGARSRRAASGDLVIATTSENDDDVCKAVAWVGQGEIAVSSDAFIYRHSLEPKYVAYFFQTHDFRTQKRQFISGTKVRRISGADLARIRVPVPPIQVQQEIVRILDTFSELEAELKAELKLRVQQYYSYRERLLNFEGRSDVRWTSLGDVCNNVSSGGTPLSTRSDFYGGTIPWLRTQEVNYADIHATALSITEKGLAESSAKWVRPNSVIVAISGAGVTRGRVAVNRIALTTNQHCCNLEVDEEQAAHRYVYYWLVHHYDDLRSQGQGNRSDLNMGIIKAYPIALPPPEEQGRIVEILDKLDRLVNDMTCGLPAEIAARQKQYGFYCDQLLSLPERVA